MTRGTEESTVGRSPDGRRLYHDDSARNQVLVHDVAEDGSCTNRRVFTEAPRGVPDRLGGTIFRARVDVPGLAVELAKV